MEMWTVLCSLMPVELLFPQPLSLTSAQENELKALVDPLQDSSNYTIELYDQIRQFVLNNAQ